MSKTVRSVSPLETRRRATSAAMNPVPPVIRVAMARAYSMLTEKPPSTGIAVPVT